MINEPGFPRDGTPMELPCGATGYWDSIGYRCGDCGAIWGSIGCGCSKHHKEGKDDQESDRARRA